MRLQSPTGRVTRKTFVLKASRRGRRRQQLELRVPAPKLWSPDRPQLYDARVTLSYKGRIQQYERKRIGLRSVKVKGSQLYLNNRPIQIRGASIHDDFAGVGAAVNGYAMDTTVRELKELGANVTRSHYVLSEAMLSRLDRAGHPRLEPGARCGSATTAPTSCASRSSAGAPTPRCCAR